MKKIFAALLITLSAQMAQAEAYFSDSLDCKAAAIGVFNSLAQSAFGIRGDIYTVDYLTKVSEDATHVVFKAVVEGGKSSSVDSSAKAEKVMLGFYEITMKNDTSMKCVVQSVILN